MNANHPSRLGAKTILKLIRASCECRIYVKKAAICFVFGAFFALFAVLIGNARHALTIGIVIGCIGALFAVCRIAVCGMKINWLLKDPDGYRLGSGKLDCYVGKGKYQIIVTWIDGEMTRVTTRQILPRSIFGTWKRKNLDGKDVLVGYHAQTKAFFTLPKEKIAQ